MTGIDRKKSTRRAFFVQGGAVLGSSVATVAGAAALTPGKPAPIAPDDELARLRQQLGSLTDREAIRQLHLTFIGLVEQQRYEAAAELFDEQAHLDLSGLRAYGKTEIRQAFAEGYRAQQGCTLHNAYRQNAACLKDSVAIDEAQCAASATFHLDVELAVPLTDGCTIAQMARLQGNVAERRWEAGRFESKYRKTAGQWKVTALSYRRSE